MKRCPFCAEEIQDAALVCKHCRRDVSPAAIRDALAGPKSKTSPLAMGCAIVFCIALTLFVIAIMSNTPPTDSNGKPILKVGAGRNLLGFLLTNREATPITSCEVTVLGDEHDEWTAVTAETIAPFQTVTFPWSTFTLRGQTMPPYLGRSSKYFTFACDVGSERRSAGTMFQQ